MLVQCEQNECPAHQREYKQCYRIQLIDLASATIFDPESIIEFLKSRNYSNIESFNLSEKFPGAYTPPYFPEEKRDHLRNMTFPFTEEQLSEIISSVIHTLMKTV